MRLSASRTHKMKVAITKARHHCRLFRASWVMFSSLQSTSAVRFHLTAKSKSKSEYTTYVFMLFVKFWNSWQIHIKLLTLFHYVTTMLNF